MRNEYSIVVKAVDNGAPGLSNSTNVTILVPVNHPPSVQNSFHFYIMENSALGQFVGKITAEDRDLGRVKGEKLTFTLVDKAGKIFLLLNINFLVYLHDKKEIYDNIYVLDIFKYNTITKWRCKVKII